MNWLKEKDYFLCAVMFFTRISVPETTPFSEQALNESRKYFPFIGIVIGCLAALTIYLGQFILPLSIAVIASIIVTILATGAFHEDGFADSCDGFGGGWDKEQILTIMKDSRIGSYGAVGIVMLLALKIATLVEIGLYSLPLLLLCCVNAHALSRFGASLCVNFLDYVQEIDKSKSKPMVNQRLTTSNLTYSFMLISPAIILLLAFDFALILVTVPLIATFFVAIKYFKNRLGGYSGDCLGALQQVLEVVFYLSVLVITGLA